MKLSRRMFQLAFGCHHRQLSRVFTLERRTYQVCLHCGQQVEYSWDLMQPRRRMIPAKPERRGTMPGAPKSPSFDPVRYQRS
jgi:hypothetical protein